jgi:hypothetical protein
VLEVSDKGVQTVIRFVGSDVSVLRRPDLPRFARAVVKPACPAARLDAWKRLTNTAMSVRVLHGIACRLTSDDEAKSVR